MPLTKTKPETMPMSPELAAVQGVLDGSPLGTLLLDPSGRILHVNAAAAQIFGHFRQDLVGRPIETLFADGFRRRLDEALKRARGVRGPGPVELQGRHRRGNTLPIELTVAPIEAADGRLAVAYFRDLSERRQLEERARLAQKMEAVGRLAGGVAHDFNNLLTAILGYSAILLRKVQPEQPMWAELQQIKRAGERAAALTKQLLAFSRKQVLAPVVLDLNALVTGLEDMLHRLIREDIQLVVNVDPQVKPVKADPTQLEQVLVNLVVNARDAMPKGGRIVISTSNIGPSRVPAGTMPYMQLNSFALLSVADTGTGMDDATKARLFEPFFTTKAVGHGTGLGLATVYGIVKQSGGQIDVQSELGRGTTFNVYLPQVEELPAEPEAAEPLAPGAGRGAETILLAEDEEGVRLLAGRVLESHGYRVLHARDGEEALDVCRQHTGALHLLLTDVVMPNLNGRELVSRVTRLRPGIKVIYMSGYTDSIIALHKILESGAAFIQKPFSPELLIRTVREALDMPVGAGGGEGGIAEGMTQGWVTVVSAAEGERK
jgi:PAS domain S-box-containing protein